MTPAEQRVIQAAQAYWLDADAADSHNALMEAVQALDAERKAGVEQEIRWDQVVESDQIYSARTRKWYPVISSGPSKKEGRVRIQATGLPESITPPAAGMVRVKRGPTGQAVDMWNIAWSMQTIPTIRESEDPT
jgi:hypothetical protein